MEDYLDLLALIITVSDLPDTVLSDLPIIIMKISCLTNVAFVVLTHANFLNTFLLIIFLTIVNGCQKAFLSILFCMYIVKFLHCKINHDKIRLQYKKRNF